MINRVSILTKLNGYRFKNPNKNLTNSNDTLNMKSSFNNLSFGNSYKIPYQAIYGAKYIKTDKGFQLLPSELEIKQQLENSKASAFDLWRDLNKENEAKQYFVLKEQEIYETSIEAKAMLEKLDEMSASEKAKFVDIFCKETGFPSLTKVASTMEKEILRGVHELAYKNNFDVKFVGYDKNCSIGRKCALPGRDCDALFIIIEPPKGSPDWFAGARRWEIKDTINQRIVSTASNHLPEVLTTDYIKEGLDMALVLFDKADFDKEDLDRFKDNLLDSTNDFVKSAEFNIRLAKKLPSNKETRDKFYKTAMLVELIRDGRILENNFSSEFIDKIKKSPLYKYSNITKQQGIKGIEKQKHSLRRKMVDSFETQTPEKQFQIVRDVLHSSLGLNDVINEKLFTNDSKNGDDEMGNIEEMYEMLQNEVE